MVTDMQLISKMYLLASSCLMALATFTAIKPLVDAILSTSTLLGAVWSPHYARWQQLRQKSQLFSALDRWIVGLADLISRRAPWFLALPTPENAISDGVRTAEFRVRLILARLFAVVFGSPERLAQAARGRTTEYPWSPAELTATGILFGSAAFAMVSIHFFNRWALSTLLFGSSFAAWLVYRAWLHNYIHRAAMRLGEILRFLPHALDSIALGMEADGNLAAALDEIIADFPNQPLCQEFLQVRVNLDGGMFPHEALNELAERINLVEIKELVDILRQRDEHAVPINESIRRLANSVRKKRLSAMEEAIGRTETSLALPTALITLACLLSVAAPFVLSVINSGLLP